MSKNEQSTVLVVEDERQLADLYQLWLSNSYSVKTAYRGEQALEALDDDPDVVLLDRRMPDISGDTILETIRDQSLNSRVAMVTAVEPDLNIVDMGFDDYLLKPVAKSDLLDTVDWLISLTSYDAILQEYFTLASKIGALEVSHEQAYLESNEEYEEVKNRFEQLKNQEREHLETLHEGGRSKQVFSRVVNNWNRRTSGSTS